VAAYQGRRIRMQEQKVSIRARTCRVGVAEGGEGEGDNGEERRRFYILRRRGRILGRDGRHSTGNYGDAWHSVRGKKYLHRALRARARKREE